MSHLLMLLDCYSRHMFVVIAIAIYLLLPGYLYCNIATIKMTLIPKQLD